MILVSKTANYVCMYILQQKIFLLSTFNAFVIYDIFLESVKDTMWLLFFAVHTIYYCTFS